MSRPSSIPKLGQAQDFFLSLYEDVAVDLHVYCEVLGSQRTKVINRAVRALIDADLRDNAGIRIRFEDFKEQFIEQERRKGNIGDGHAQLRVIKPRGVGNRRKGKPDSNRN